MNCPKCGSEKTIKFGPCRIKCNACGRTTTIKPVKRETPNYNERPACPRCGAHYAVRNGGTYDYVCKNCGKYFNDLEEF